MAIATRETTGLTWQTHKQYSWVLTGENAFSLRSPEPPITYPFEAWNRLMYIIRSSV